MAYHKLALKRTANTRVDAVIYGTDDSGNPLTISTTEAADLSEEHAAKLRGQGYELIPVDEPSEESQPVGADVVGMSPVVEQSDAGVGIDQQAQERIDQEAGAGTGEQPLGTAEAATAEPPIQTPEVSEGGEI